MSENDCVTSRIRCSELAQFGHNHLLQIRTMVFGVAALAHGRAAFSFEVQRGGIEERQVQTGEQVPVLREIAPPR